MPRISRCATTDSDIRNDRRRHPQRPAQTSATTGADGSQQDYIKLRKA
ncbi:hypothetical protein [Leyella stercorea]